MTSKPRITLEQYAGIRAAVAENIPLAEVLVQEQVKARRFREAEPIWRERIADSMELQLEYMQKLRIAEDCLARKLSPIEDDEAAWVGLLGGLATSLDVPATLAQLGITMNDMGRLGRVWKRRTQKDSAVGERLAELAKTPIPPVRVEASPVVLKPFPWTKSRAPVPAASLASPSEPTQADGPVSVAKPVQRVLASFQVAPSPVIATGPSVLGMPVVPLPQPALVPAPNFASWTLLSYVQLARALRTNPADAEGAMSRAGLVTSESRRLVHEHFRRRFDAEPGLRAEFDALLGSDRGSQSPTGTEELDTRQFKRGPAIPFVESRKPPLTPTPSPRASTGQAAKHSDADAAALARMKTAFAGSDRSAPLNSTLDPDETQAPFPRAGQGPALPFSGGRSNLPAVAPAKAQSGVTVGIAAVPMDWTIERYARLSVDLELSGLPETTILSLAQLDGSARTDLDAYFRVRMQLDPALRAEWQKHADQRVRELRNRRGC